MKKKKISVINIAILVVIMLLVIAVAGVIIYKFYPNLFGYDCEVEGHVYSEWIVETNETCEVDGKKYIKCTKCKKIVDTQTIAALGHDYTDWVVSAEATCCVDGARYMECNRCHNKIEEVIERYDHKYVNGVCEVCGVINCKGKHTLSEWVNTKQATCTQTGSRYKECNVCHEIVKKEVIQKLKHDFSDYVIESEATCNENGSKYRTCNVCGEVDSVVIETIPHNYENGKCSLCGSDECKEHVLTDWIILQEASCAESGFKIKKCTLCNETLERGTIAQLSEHTFDPWIVDLEATCVSEGEEHRICNICGYIEVETTALLTHSYYDGVCIYCNFEKKCVGLEINNKGIFLSVGTCKDSDIVIPKGVKEVAAMACYYNYKLENISLPSTVIKIGAYAFYQCTALKSFNVPSGVSTIEEGVLGACTSLKKISVDSNNQTFDSRNNCNAIIETKTNKLVVGCKETVIPNTIKSIGNSAFKGMTGIKSITIPNGVVSIGEFAFANCTNLTSITLPNSVTSLGSKAFWECSSLKKITLSNKSTSIEAYCFYFCTSLESISIPNSVSTIGEGAFWCCDALKTITLTNSVKTIGIMAFGECGKLTTITYQGTKSQFRSYNYQFDLSQNLTINCSDGKISVVKGVYK